MLFLSASKVSAVRARTPGFECYFTRKDRRPGLVIEIGPFYSLFSVGDYTFASWKVVWPRISKSLVAAVVGQN